MPLHRSSGQWRLGLLLSLVTVFFWGVLAVFLKVLLQALDAYTITWFRFLFAFSLLAGYLAAKRQLPSLKQLRAIPHNLLLAAIFGLALNYIFFLLGLGQTSPNNAQVIIQIAPVMLGFGSLILFKEKYTRQQWLGVGILALGMTLFFHEQLRMLVANWGSYLIGNVLLLLGAIVWAIYALAQKQLLQSLTSPAIVLCIYGSSALLFSPIASPAKILTLSPLYMGILIFSALNTSIAYGAFAEALEHWEASRVSAVLALTPLVTLGTTSILPTIWPKLFAPDPLTWLGFAGAIFVVLGSLTISLGSKQTGHAAKIQ